MIPITMPVLGKTEATAAAAVVLSDRLSQGPQVAAFETEFAALVAAKYACAVSNCSVALHLALLAIGISAGDEVITVSHTFIAAANAILQCGAIPVFVDIHPGTFTILPDAIEEAITPRTRAILCVHQMGMPCDLSQIVPLARARGLFLIEDAASAIGSNVKLGGKWQPIGRPHGDIACFSFHASKILTVGDGGMLTTNNPEWNQKFRLWRQHEMKTTSIDGRGAMAPGRHSVLGFNYRMTDIQAAIGRAQLKRLPDILYRRRRLAERYQEMLASLPGVLPPEEPVWASANWNRYCVRLPAGADQRVVIQYMRDQHIAAHGTVMCVHQAPSHAHLQPRHPLPESERANRECILLPLFPQMTKSMQEMVVSSLGRALS